MLDSVTRIRWTAWNDCVCKLQTYVLVLFVAVFISRRRLAGAKGSRHFPIRLARVALHGGGNLVSSQRYFLPGTRRPGALASSPQPALGHWVQSGRGSLQRGFVTGLLERRPQSVGLSCECRFPHRGRW